MALKHIKHVWACTDMFICISVGALMKVPKGVAENEAYFYGFKAGMQTTLYFSLVRFSGSQYV